MTTDEKILALIEKLYLKTQRGDIIWEETTTAEEFQAAFSKNTVQLYQSENGGYCIRILNESGHILESASSYDLMAKAPDHNGVHLEMERLFTMARRQALGVDSALDNLLDEIS